MEVDEQRMRSMNEPNPKLRAFGVRHEITVLILALVINPTRYTLLESSTNKIQYIRENQSTTI